MCWASGGSVFQGTCSAAAPAWAQVSALISCYSIHVSVRFQFYYQNPNYSLNQGGVGAPLLHWKKRVKLKKGFKGSRKSRRIMIILVSAVSLISAGTSGPRCSVHVVKRWRRECDLERVTRGILEASWLSLDPRGLSIWTRHPACMMFHLRQT